MRRVIIIGDSHAAHMVLSLYDYGGTKSAFFTYDGYIVEVLVHNGQLAYNLDYSNVKSIYKEEIDSDAIIMPFFGENDIRRKLLKYNNIEETVSKYIEKTINFFPKNRIIFIEPVPQSAEAMATDYGLKERVETHIEFTNYLREKCIEKKLDIPLRVTDYLGKEIQKKVYLEKKFLMDDVHLNKQKGEQMFINIIFEMSKMIGDKNVIV